MSFKQILFVLLSFLCLSSEAQEMQTAIINNIKRSYLLHLPDNLKKNAPLVFVLHGYGGVASPKGYGMDEVSDKYGLAV